MNTESYRGSKVVKYEHRTAKGTSSAVQSNNTSIVQRRPTAPIGPTRTDPVRSAHTGAVQGPSVAAVLPGRAAPIEPRRTVTVWHDITVILSSLIDAYQSIIKDNMRNTGVMNV